MMMVIIIIIIIYSGPTYTKCYQAILPKKNPENWDVTHLTRNELLRTAKTTQEKVDVNKKMLNQVSLVG